MATHPAIECLIHRNFPPKARKDNPSQRSCGPKRVAANAGTSIVAVADSNDGQRPNSLGGDALCLLSGGFYACYTVAIKRMLGRDEDSNTVGCSTPYPSPPLGERDDGVIRGGAAGGEVFLTLVSITEVTAVRQGGACVHWHCILVV